MEKLTMLLLMLIHGHYASEDSCAALNPSETRLTLKVYKNITGHWVTQVTLARGPASSQAGGELELWDVDVLQTATPCEAGDAVSVVTTVSSPPRRAGPGYELFPGLGHYKLHTAPLDWKQARAKCAEEGAHLAVVNSEAESAVLRQLLAQHPHVAGSDSQNYAYIGFHDRYVEGQYVTVLGTPLEAAGFARWAGPTQPDNAGGGAGKVGEDCGSLHRNGGLNDITCSHKLPFFCEQELW
ncbi:hemolymph lipopolysaccharide-binding protein-like [Bacillus rossius redtenbacheri]|uniref:hemolymph lipopolysaccharide-binding protein-like n=1 Tax=Bacillus rossius redtenbacheri TaxID=93214 RepID=UPI002FDD4044